MNGQLLTKVAYSGIRGAYANIAAMKIMKNGEYVSYPSFGSVYDAVVKGECTHGVLPIENSFAGDVAQVLDLLYFGDLSIIGIYEMPIVHYLLGIPGSTISDIKTVYSHPQALDQCSAYIREHGFVKAVATNTAVAAKEVSEKNDPSIAAIAGKETAKFYGLTILGQEINERDDNTTRFALIAKNDRPLLEKRESFSLILTVKNEAGAFAKAITTIGNGGFNMRAIRSRPAKSLAWKYYFYIEGEGDLSGEAGKMMLSKLRENCETIRVLGNYADDVML